MKGKSHAVRYEENKFCESCGDKISGKVSKWKKFCFDCKYNGDHKTESNTQKDPERSSYVSP